MSEKLYTQEEMDMRTQIQTNFFNEAINQRDALATELEELKAENEKLRKGLRDIYQLARRRFSSSTCAHIERICKDIGCQPSILREEI